MGHFLYLSLAICCSIQMFHSVQSQPRPPAIGTAEQVYSWPILEFDWESDQQRQDFIKDNLYIPDNCPFTGIKVYKGKTYVNVPRWRLGVPSSMNVVVEKNGQNYLQPYPSWEMQILGDCNALQFVQSMEIDPNTGLIWMIDSGRINLFPASTGPQEPVNLCPPKLVIYDLNTNTLVHKYEFPPNVVNPNSTFLNDIILDYVDGEARYAYITDTFDFKLVVFDRKTNTSYFFQDLESMSTEGPDAGDVTVGNITLSVGVLGINGIAMASNFEYVYYGPVAGVSLYQVPTSLLRNPERSSDQQFPEIRKVGEKIGHSDGMLATMGGSIYFPVLPRNALYKWELENDMKTQGVAEGAVTMTTETEVIRNDDTMQWIDTLGIDEEGYIWFTAPAVQRWMTGNMDLSGASGDNFYIWKVFINEYSYLHNAANRTKISQPVYSWTELEFDWENDQQKQNFIDSNLYIPENCPSAGIKVYKGKAYVIVPRWRLGVPSSMNVVVEKNGRNYLQPYPSWDMQTVGDCNALQFIQAIEIDPNTGLLWMVDSGRINLFPPSTDSKTQNLCPPKLVIYDLNTNTQVHKYEFPSSVVNPNSTYLNDIVLDYFEGEARYAYITDTFDSKLVVFDRKTNTSYFFKDVQSMSPEKPPAGDVTVNGITLSLGILGINGIAMSPKFDYVYFTPVAGFGVYQVPTSLLRKPERSSDQQFPEIRKVGEKIGHSDGMLATQGGNIYFPVLPRNALYKWELENDMKTQGVAEGAVTMTTETEVVRNDDAMQWIDTLAIDEEGYIWFTAPAVQRWITGSMDFTGASGDNFYIWKVFVNEQGYLHNAKTKISKDPQTPNTANNTTANIPIYLMVFHFLQKIISYFSGNLN